MARHTKIAGGAGRCGAVLTFGALVFGAGLWLAPAANAEELVQLALLDLNKLEALSDHELDGARGTGADAPEVDAAIGDQFAVILWDETKRQGSTSAGSTGGNVTVTVNVADN